MEILHPAENKELTLVTSLHLLIHPGFIHPQRSDEIFPSESPTDSRSMRAEALLDSYITRAEGFKPDEIMIAMMYEDFPTLLQDFRENKAYTQKLSKLKLVLGSRLIALSDNQDIGQHTSYTLAESIAKRRGFILPKNLYSEAYGETIQCCVPEAASTANRSLNLEYLTTINPLYTDHPYINERSKQQVLDDYDRIQFIK